MLFLTPMEPPPPRRPHSITSSYSFRGGPSNMPCIFSPSCLCSHDASQGTSDYSATHFVSLAKAFLEVLNRKGALRLPCTHSNKQVTLTSLCDHCRHPPNACYEPVLCQGASPTLAPKYNDPHSTRKETQAPGELTCSGSHESSKRRLWLSKSVWLQR